MIDRLFSLWPALVTITAVIAVVMGIDAYLILLERKISAWMQDRLGPNRVGPMGLLQPIADGLKFLFKEDIVPDYVDKLLYFLAPAIALGTALFAFVVVPFGATSLDYHEYQFVIAPHVDIGIVFVFAISSLAVYAVILGGWASNNKYSFIGGLRSSAQLISYEIPMGMAILGVVLFSGSLNLERIISQQTQHGILGWNIWYQPLAFLLFLTSVFAECNRLPFDLPEAEQELVGGYHTEYSALKFGMFFLGEYTHMITTSFLMVILFFGGWHFPAITNLSGLGGDVVKFLVFFVKMSSFIVLYMVVRWTIPRFRFDQLIGMAWKVLIPLALLNLVCVMIVLQLKWSPWVLLATSAILLVGMAFLAGLWPRESAGSMVAARRERLQAMSH